MGLRARLVLLVSVGAVMVLLCAILLAATQPKEAQQRQGAGSDHRVVWSGGGSSPQHAAEGAGGGCSSAKGHGGDSCSKEAGGCGMAHGGSICPAVGQHAKGMKGSGSNHSEVGSGLPKSAAEKGTSSPTQTGETKESASAA